MILQMLKKIDKHWFDSHPTMDSAREEITTNLDAAYAQAKEDALKNRKPAPEPGAVPLAVSRGLMAYKAKPAASKRASPSEEESPGVETFAAPAPAPAPAAAAAAPQTSHAKVKMVFDPKPVGRGKMKGGITEDERLYIAIRARMEAIDAPMRELAAMRNQLRPIRDNPAVGMNNRRRAGLAMDAIADDMRVHMDAHRAEFLDLRERLRGMPKPDLTPGRPLDDRPHPRQRPPVGKSPLSR